MVKFITQPLLRNKLLGASRLQFATSRPLSTKINFNDAATSFQSKSFSELMRAYIVFQTCRVRFLVTHSEEIVKRSYMILGDGLTDYGLRKTFFGHFCAGQDTSDMGPTIRRLEQAGIGSIFDYAAEADIVEDATVPLTPAEQKISSRVYAYKDEEECDQRVAVFESCIRSAHELRGSKSSDAFAAVKVTALGNPKLLERISNAIVEIRNLFLKFDVDKNGRVSKEEFRREYNKYFEGGMSVEEVFKMMDNDSDDMVDYVEWSNGLTIEELHKLTSYCRNRGPLSAATLTEEERELLIVMKNRVDKIVALADQLNVKLMIDAEHTYFQPAIDNISHMLMKKYNKDRALIFGTYQMYLVDAHERLLDDVARAKAGGYHFACKLVRGAYMELERKRALELKIPSPIHVSKQATHDNYNRGVAFLVDKIAAGEKVRLMIASHNQQSIELALDQATKRGLTPDAYIYFGQLLGMADHLTYSLGGSKYRAYKYVPYGKIKEVMPYLIRRAQENSDIMGGVGVEINMLKKEIVRRLNPFAK